MSVYTLSPYEIQLIAADNLNTKVCVQSIGGRCFTGNLHSVDQFGNLVLTDSNDSVDTVIIAGSAIVHISGTDNANSLRREEKEAEKKKKEAEEKKKEDEEKKKEDEEKKKEAEKEVELKALLMKSFNYTKPLEDD